MHSARRREFFVSWRIAVLVPGILVAVIAMTAATGRIDFHDDFSSGKLDAWQFPFAEDWVVRTEGPLHYLHMLRNREPLVPRRPQQFARIKGINVGSFTLEARVRRAGGSMAIAFNYVDNLHFYYTHLSVDPGTKVDVHNGIFLVDGAPRRRIAGVEAAAALPDTNWHKVRVERNADSGSIKVFVDDDTQPRFAVIDKTFKCGQVGLGSFDETGDYADVKLSSKDAGCRP
ncbi:MAG: hypothetical protein ACLQVG_14310 [Terriglobia bacterium]